MSTFASFIVSHLDDILVEWEQFARTTGPAADGLPSHELRDHARVVLQAVAADMQSRQTAREQREKSIGADDAGPVSAVTDTARQHARHRFDQGFTLPEMVSEYRALRAYVIRRWTVQLEHADAAQLAELTRFGEAIDEGLTEALAWYSKRLEDSRNMLIGVLAHDLRSPLAAVKMSAEYLLRTDRLQDGELRAATRIASSSARMTGYVNDLLDFTQTLLGAGLTIARTPVDLATLCEDVVDELQAAHPAANVLLDVQARPTAPWDPARLSQLLSNLITNAIIHGDLQQPVTLSVGATGGVAFITVHNFGEPISAGKLPTLFQPLMQSGPAQQRRRGSSGLGLGLYIAREIALAHGGTIEATSNAETGTTFEVHLPLA